MVLKRRDIQLDRSSQAIRLAPAFASNDGEVIRQSVLAGMGIFERSEWSVAAELTAKRLVRVLPD